ncbi:hypothetical protein 18India_46 [Salmonella phage 18-India]|nr:hypothetical protein 18India_46 [Salmonella phage 18-India]
MDFIERDLWEGLSGYDVRAVVLGFVTLGFNRLWHDDYLFDGME